MTKINAKFDNREDWLDWAGHKLLDYFEAMGVDKAKVQAARTFHVTCGWPSVKGTGAKKRRIGECWPRGSSSRGVNEMFISPTLDDPMTVLSILGHELVHAVDDCESGHKKGFLSICDAVGWTEGKPTTRAFGEEAKEFCKSMVDAMPSYPHGKITVQARETKDKCRLLKAECDGCGFIIRTTRTWMDTVGLPVCRCGGNFEEAS